VLRRHLETVELKGQKLQVKVVERPEGARTGKTEAADVAGHRGHVVRTRLRREAVAHALDPSGQNRNGADDEAE
jgi:hypothetical protein